MSRARALLLFVLVAACGDGAVVPPAPPASPGKTVGPKPPEQPEDRALAAAEEQRKKSDEYSRGLLKSFASRVYEPARDSFLARAEGTVAVRVDGKEASYRFVYDGAKPAGEAVTVEVVSEPPDLAPGTSIEVRRWVTMSCLGADVAIAYHKPPTALALTPSTDGTARIVLAPPFKSELSVSYRFDARDLIVSRGEWTDQKHRAVHDYDWEKYGEGRWLLRRDKTFEGPVTDFTYADTDGVRLIARVQRTEPGRSLDAVLRYSGVRRRPN